MRGFAIPSPVLEAGAEENLLEYWRHVIDLVVEAGVETIWTLTFRAHRDHYEERRARVAQAKAAYARARSALAETEYGVFEQWHPRPGQRDLFHLNNLEQRLRELDERLTAN